MAFRAELLANQFIIVVGAVGASRELISRQAWDASLKRLRGFEWEWCSFGFNAESGDDEGGRFGKFCPRCQS